MQLARNSLYSLAGTGIPLAASLVTIPLLVGQIGAARFGALAIVWILLGYFGGADLGIGRAIAQRLASRPGETDAERARAVWSALWMIAGISFAIGVIAYAVASGYFAEAFDVEGSIRAELRQAIWLLVPGVVIAAISGVPAGALMGLERWRSMAAGTSIGQVGMQVAPLAVALLYSTDMSQLVLAVVVGRAVGAVVLLASLWRVVLRQQPVRGSRDDMRSLAQFGVWVMVGALIGPLMVISDRFVIGALLGAAAVTAYTIPFQVAYRTLALPMALSQALFPRLAGAADHTAREQCRDITLLVGQVFAPLVVALIVLAAPLLHLWLGADLDPRSILVAELVLAGVWVNAVAQVPSAFIQARGDSRFTGLLIAIEFPAYVALMFAMGSKFGVVGFAAAFALRCAVDCVILLGRAGIGWLETLRGLLVPGLFVAVSLLAARIEFPTLIAVFASVGLASAAAFAALLKMPPSTRQRLSSALRLR